MIPLILSDDVVSVFDVIKMLMLGLVAKYLKCHCIWGAPLIGEVSQGERLFC